jgi:hypothetical protein
MRVLPPTSETFLATCALWAAPRPASPELPDPSCGGLVRDRGLGGGTETAGSGEAVCRHDTDDGVDARPVNGALGLLQAGSIPTSAGQT